MGFNIVKLTDPIQFTSVAGGLVPRGAYNGATDYAVGDSVDYNGSSYVMHTNAGAGTLPTNTTYWQILASKGDAGAGGEGVPTGGTAGQLLAKIDGTDYNTEWVDPSASTSVDFVSNVATSTVLGRTTAGSGNSEELTAAQVRTLINVEDGADVTDATNVAAAGAFIKSVDDTDDITEGTTKKFATAAEKTKLSHITVTQAVDLDTLESDTATNNAKVSNATHTGDVTGATALTIANDAVTNAKAANMAVNTIKGRITSGTGDPEDLTAANVRTIINVADGATANSSDATLLNRANHTGTQTASTISDFSTAADARITAATGVSVQGYDADLQAIGAMSPSNDDIIQRKAGAWTNRTMAQVKTDLALTKADVGLSNVDNTSDATKDAASATLTNKTISGSSNTLTNIAQSSVTNLTTDLAAKPSISSGSGAPASTPTKVGDIYIDTTGDDAYIAVGTASSADWEKTNDGAGGGLSDGDKGDITVSASGATWTIDNDVVTYAKMQNVSATSRFLGRITAGAGDTEELTGAQATSLLDTFTSGAKGLAPASGGGTTNFLRADGSWAAPTGGSGDVVGPASATDNAITRYDATTGKLIQNSSVTISDNGEILLAAGGTADAPLKFQSGTNLTTPEAGAIEYDGEAFYSSVAASNRGLIPSIYFIRQDADRTLTNSTANQKIFDSVTNGTLTLPTGTYLYEAFLRFSGMSATSGNLDYDLLGAGTATLGTVSQHFFGQDASINTAGAVGGSFAAIASSPANAVTAATATALMLQVKGTFEVTSAGTIIPSVALTTAAAATFTAGSYMTFNRIGSTSVVSVGQWS